MNLIKNSIDNKMILESTSNEVTQSKYSDINNKISKDLKKKIKNKGSRRLKKN